MSSSHLFGTVSFRLQDYNALLRTDTSSTACAFCIVVMTINPATSTIQDYEYWNHHDVLFDSLWNYIWIILYKGENYHFIQDILNIV